MQETFLDISTINYCLCPRKETTPMQSKKTASRLLLLALTAVIFTGCKDRGENDAYADSKTPDTQNTGTVLSAVQTPGASTAPPESAGETTRGEASQKLTDSGFTQDQVMHPVTLKDGKAWGDLPVVGAEDEVYCNLQQNIKENENLLLLCPDPLHGMTYYVNHGDDYFIYALKDGTAQLVVEIPAKRLFVRGGVLYFMVEDYDRYVLDGLENGDILSYNPSDGNVCVIVSGLWEDIKPEEKTVFRNGVTAAIPESVEVEETNMTVYQDGIYYIQSGKNLEISDTYYWCPERKYYYSFETGTSERLADTPWLSCLTFVRWDDYLVAWEQPDYNGNDFDLRYNLRKDQQLLDQQLQPVRSLGFACSPFFYLVGDKAYTTSSFGGSVSELGYSYADASTNIISYDLRTGEDTTYLFEHGENVSLSAFFLFQDRMLFNDLAFYSLSEEKGHYAYCNLLEPNNIGSTIVTEFYTDGSQLFAISALDHRMYRIEMCEDTYVVAGANYVYDYRFDFFPIAE